MKMCAPPPSSTNRQLAEWRQNGGAFLYKEHILPHYPLSYILRSMVKSPHEILLYYLYTQVEDPEALRLEQQALCEKLNLKGRIIISTEGINGTVAGARADTQAYVDACAQSELLKEMQFKRSDGLEDAFPKLNIKVRKEIVCGKLQEDDFHPTQITGKRLTPAELHKWFEEGKDFTIIDMRNSYEYRFGHFENSIDPGMRRFEDLPGKLDELKQYQEKTVVTVCTGGVRCEKASGYLVKKGFDDVYQLDGGIVSYMEQFPGHKYDGSLFVFDKRQVMHFNGENHQPISACDYCSNTTERFKNCADSKCNRKCVACMECVPKGETRLCRECESRVTA
jgi:UPF0176 protein